MLGTRPLGAWSANVVPNPSRTEKENQMAAPKPTVRQVPQPRKPLSGNPPDTTILLSEKDKARGYTKV